mmetsp:Transcript_11531/g.30839  ORF Transcript_11531/g.30839 Transcript_11531/m.30839 type:complete len:121 (+) Transcript_11531:38-400(+)
MASHRAPILLPTLLALSAVALLVLAGQGCFVRGQPHFRRLAQTETQARQREELRRRDYVGVGRHASEAEEPATKAPPAAAPPPADAGLEEKGTDPLVIAIPLAIIVGLFYTTKFLMTTDN